MKLYIYRGLDKEKVPKDVTHVIIDSSVTVIKERAFQQCSQCSQGGQCKHLVSIIMGDSVKRIEDYAFYGCIALRFIRISKKLEIIGRAAFAGCHSLEALFLPSTVRSIEDFAFMHCRSLRLLILPHDIDLGNVGYGIIRNTPIYQIAKTAGVAYEYDGHNVTDESIRRVNEWLIHHMDEAPFHKLCYNSSVTTKQINNYLNEHGNDLALSIDPIRGMTPMHMLSMNPHAPSETIAALLDVNMDVAFRLDNEGKMSLDYARDYNIGGLVATITVLCNNRNAAYCNNALKRKRIDNVGRIEKFD